MKALTLTQPWATLVDQTAWARLRMMTSPVGYPLGCILATCVLVDCLSTVYQAPRGPAVFEKYPHLDTSRERAFGDYSPGRYAWVLEDVQQLAQPVPAKGALGLWEWEPYRQVVCTTGSVPR